jgi:hypothetical protein
MPKTLLIAILALAAAGIAIVLLTQHQNITKPPEAQKMDEGTRKIYVELCNLDKIKKIPDSDNCKKANP